MRVAAAPAAVDQSDTPTIVAVCRRPRYRFAFSVPLSSSELRMKVRKFGAAPGKMPLSRYVRLFVRMKSQISVDGSGSSSHRGSEKHRASDGKDAWPERMRRRPLRGLFLKFSSTPDRVLWPLSVRITLGSCARKLSRSPKRLERSGVAKPPDRDRRRVKPSSSDARLDGLDASEAASHAFGGVDKGGADLRAPGALRDRCIGAGCASCASRSCSGLFVSPPCASTSASFRSGEAGETAPSPSLVRLCRRSPPRNCESAPSDILVIPPRLGLRAPKWLRVPK